MLDTADPRTRGMHHCKDKALVEIPDQESSVAGFGRIRVA